MSLTRDAAGIQAAEMMNIADFHDREVLEIGCGEGYITYIYASKTKHVDAIDPESDRIEKAKGGLPADLKEKVAFIAADIADYETAIPGKRYDIAIFAWSL